MKKTFLALLLLASAGAHAQTSPAKQALVDKVLSLQRPPSSKRGRSLPSARFADAATGRCRLANPRAPGKREAVGKDLQADLKNTPTRWCP